ncbi:MAG: hypothetical protein GY732_03715 [Gammaproteobacteria bacterium]|nr:hypothetical protein [Gammaproteobacteria bacterium]
MPGEASPESNHGETHPGTIAEPGLCRAYGIARTGSPDDYGDATLYLAADAGYVTGQTLNVDDGLMT